MRRSSARPKPSSPPYVEADPTAFCSYEDHLLAVDTLLEVCRLRAESIRGQLNGDYPATLAQQAENPGAGVDASHVDLRDLGDFEDLENARHRQNRSAEGCEIERHGSRCMVK